MKQVRFMENSKVYENSGKRIVIFSDNGVYKLTATRRAISDVVYGVAKYYGSQWHIETFKRQGSGFVPVVFPNLPSIFRKKQEIIDTLSRSVQFKQAYQELKG